MSYSPGPADLAQWVRLQIAARFADEDEIAESARDVFELDESDEPALEEALRQAVASDAKDRATWPAVTDCDRLDRAFDALEDAGVLARQSFACCRRCGNREMFDLVHDEREKGKTVDGYVFYHAQDTDAVVAGGSLHLRYAAMSGGDDATKAIGHRVVEALRAHGLAAKWDGRATRTIQLPTFLWQRRSPPARPAIVRDAASCVDAWCRELPRLAKELVARSLGRGYGGVAVAMGAIEVALAWARSHPARAPDAGSRSWALVEIANALREAGADPARVSATLGEACQVAPWGRDGALIEVLLAMREETPDAWDVVRQRVLATRRDVNGAAVIAWYLVRAPSDANADDLFAAVEAIVPTDADRYERPHEASSRVVYASALWVLRARRGDADGADEARARASTDLDEVLAIDANDVALRAYLAAAAEVGALAKIAPEVIEAVPAATSAVVDALARAGELDAAEELAGLGDVASLASLARRGRREARAPLWIDRATAAFAGLDRQHADGLVSDVEALDARLIFARLLATVGRREAAGPIVACVVERARAALDLAGKHMRAFLEEGRTSATPPGLPADARWLTPEGATETADALEKWRAASDLRLRLRARHACGTVLSAAAALGRAGRGAEGLKLIEAVIGVAGVRAVVDWQLGALVAAWAENGAVDRALEALDGASSSPVVTAAEAALCAALVRAGRRPEAIARLGRTIELARTDRFVGWKDWLALAPAVVLVADDARAAATAMLDAWSRANASTAELSRM